MVASKYIRELAQPPNTAEPLLDRPTSTPHTERRCSQVLARAVAVRETKELMDRKRRRLSRAKAIQEKSDRAIQRIKSRLDLTNEYVILAGALPSADWDTSRAIQKAKESISHDRRRLIQAIVMNEKAERAIRKIEPELETCKQAFSAFSSSPSLHAKITSTSTKEEESEEETQSDDSREEENMNVCVVCQDATANMVNIPCKHVCLCFECSDAFAAAYYGKERCPLCRRGIKSILKVDTNGHQKDSPEKSANVGRNPVDIQQPESRLHQRHRYRVFSCCLLLIE